MKAGVLQNLLQQQKSSKEFLTNALIEKQILGQKRKLLFDEIYNDVVSVPLYGIVSNGKQWVFTKTQYRNDNTTNIHRSHEYEINLNNPTVEQISTVVSKIMNIVFSQMTALDNSQPYKLRKIHEISTETIQEIEQQFVQCIEDEEARQSKTDEEDEE